MQNCSISTEAYQLKCNTVQPARAISDGPHWMLRLGLRSSIEKHCHLFHKLLSQLSSQTDYKKSISPLPHLVSAMQQWLTAERQLGTDAIFSPLKFTIKASQPMCQKSGSMTNECFKIIVWVQICKNISCSGSGLTYNTVYVVYEFKEPGAACSAEPELTYRYIEHIKPPTGWEVSRL